MVKSNPNLISLVNRALTNKLPSAISNLPTWLERFCVKIRDLLEWMLTLLQTLTPTDHFTQRSVPHQTASEQLHSSFRLVTLDLNQTIHFNSSRPLREIQQQSTLNNIHTANNADSIHKPENDSLLLSPNLCLFCSLFSCYHASWLIFK